MSHLRSLRLSALVLVAATSSAVEARKARRAEITPAISTRAEVRAVADGFAIYSLPQLVDIEPVLATVSVGSSVQIDKVILMPPKPASQSVVR